MRLCTIALVLGASAALAGCGQSPAGPSSRIPDVTGTYSGTTTLALPELGQSVTCPTSTAVTQNGSSVNIAPLTLSGPCAGMSIPVGQGSIDETGALLGQSNFTFDDPSCGRYTGVGSGGFFGRQLQMSLTMTSSTCWNVNMTIAVTR